MPPIPETSHWLLLPPTLLLAYMIVTTYGGYVVLAADRGQPVRFDWHQLSVYIREAAARALMWALAPLAWGSPGPTFESGAAQRAPVLLVHGHRHNRSSLWFLRSFLVHRGWRTVWAVNLDQGQGLKAAAEALATRAAELRQAAGADKIDIVAHETGGLIAAWYIKHQGGSDAVRRLVTLGTPWSGTRMAVFRSGPAAEETLWGAPILDELQPPPVPTTSVWSDTDPAVVPSESALAQGADSVHIDGAGSTDLLISARVFRAVQAALGSAA